MLQRSLVSIYSLQVKTFRLWVRSFLSSALFSADDYVVSESPSLKWPLSPKFKEGKIDFTHQGETYQAYYKRFGDLAPWRIGLVIYTEVQACVITIWSHFPSWPRNIVFLLSSTNNSATRDRHTSRKSLQPSGPSTYSSTNSLIFSVNSTSKMGSISLVILGVEFLLPNSKFAEACGIEALHHY